jgi:hypothetical protein
MQKFQQQNNISDFVLTLIANPILKTFWVTYSGISSRKQNTYDNQINNDRILSQPLIKKLIGC